MITGLILPRNFYYWKGAKPKVYADGLTRKTRRPEILRRKNALQRQLLEQIDLNELEVV